MTGRIERLVLGLFCAACLFVPAAVLLVGLLDEPAALDEGGRVTYTRPKDAALQVRNVQGRKALAVEVKNSGRGVIETDADMIPTEQRDSRVHHDASPIELRERRNRRGPAIEPAE